MSQAQALEYDWAFAFGLTLLGELALFEATFGQAYQHLEESLDLLKQGMTGPRVLGPLAWLGLAAWNLDRRAEAQQHLLAALDWASKAQQFMGLMFALTGGARLLADMGKIERAIELYALASRHPFVANSCWFETVVGRYISAAAAPLPPHLVQTARERGQSRDLDATVAELL